VQQDSSEQTGGAVPAQRTEAVTPTPPPPGQADETLVLPAFVTGKREKAPKPAEPVRHNADAEARLPSSERGMLVFVAALLGLGTLAIVLLLGLGAVSKPAPAPTHKASVAAAVPPPPAPVPSPSPSPTPSPTLSPTPSPTPPPRHTTSPGPVVLGNLTLTDPAAFCTSSNAGRARERDDGSWFCTGSREHSPFPFGANDVCRWRYLDTTAWAVTGDPADPSTWRCYT
jgi:hypothetical protein